MSRRNFKARATLHFEGERMTTVSVITSGWAYLYRTLPDGRRYVPEILMPGDAMMPSHQSGPNYNLGAEAATSVQMCVFTEDGLLAHGDHDVSIARLRDLKYACSVERQTSLAVLSAEERLCHLLLTLFSRARALGLGTARMSPFPISQAVLADACGLAPGNINRILGRLRDHGVAMIVRGRLFVQNENELTRRAVLPVCCLGGSAYPM